MQACSTQLTLGVQLQDEATFANFYAGGNKHIVAALEDVISHPHVDRVVYIQGGDGQAKSHLLQACCHYAYQLGLRASYLPLGQFMSYPPEILTGFEALDVVCIDDIHVIAKRTLWEEALFHLYNRIYDCGGRIIMAGCTLPKQLGINLPDLVSRLSAGVVFQLQNLRDHEKLSVLTMRANARGMNLSLEVAKYILTHYPRDMAALLKILDHLDKASLTAQRRLTIPFVKEVLEREKK